MLSFVTGSVQVKDEGGDLVFDVKQNVSLFLSEDSLNRNM